MRKIVLNIFFLYFLFVSCKTGSIITYENPDFENQELNEFKFSDDMYITADVKYVGGNYGLIFHIYSSKDSFTDITIQSLNLQDEDGVILYKNDYINIEIINDKSFFDSNKNLYQKSFVIPDCHVSRKEIQQNKKYYVLEYYLNGQKKKERLIRNEKKYVITST